jgi:hypothetical protein
VSSTAPSSPKLPYQDLSIGGMSVASGNLAPIPFWGDSPESWDTVVIAGMWLPGTCSIKGGVKRKHDRKGVAGNNGSTVTYLGDDEAEFRIMVRMWTDEHLSRFSAIIDALKSAGAVRGASSATTASSSRQAGRQDSSRFPTVGVVVDHPALALYGIRKVHILGYTFPEAVGGEGVGIMEASIQCLEFLQGGPAKGKVGTPIATLDIASRATAIGAAARAKPSAANSGVPWAPTEGPAHPEYGNWGVP